MSLEIETTSVNGLGFNWLKSSLGSLWVGMSASNRLGLSGVITMKMINITSSTSINGVTLIYGTAFDDLGFELPSSISLLLIAKLQRSAKKLPRRAWPAAARLHRPFSCLPLSLSYPHPKL